MKNITKGKQIAPNHFKYNGRFDIVIICSDCRRTTLEMDTTVNSPCIGCGGDSKFHVLGKWNKPVKGFLFKKDIKGFWEIKDEQ